MTLSNKIEYLEEYGNEAFFYKEDVKEFIKELKSLINKNINITTRQKRNISIQIKELAGEELSK